ncbi:hypothetical protein AJ80_07907 [Polytolypa hystricis UAMH7299]|uniref:HMG box domain-containing protein n=1 Tax=Polytolypa hystricis (strain UAMH7299) TaxID=1447883 RepID=A0A2B7XH72_POLH7|nr:hypothetical protein AJ80_07907 [Polytolypa hystricis UAMH7299]
MNPSILEGIRTRSGRSVPPHGLPLPPRVKQEDAGKVRVERQPRVKRRPKPPKSDKCGGFTIDTPLSILTKNMTHIPIKDIEGLVNRPVEVRLKEVAMKNGKIARPMNSFMLYRSAYAERTKEWCSQNNHQVVSRVSGQSWPMEPPEVRDMFERYATIERDNHQKAHPGYKFAPNKNSNTPKKKRAHEEEGEGSVIEDPDFDIGGYPRNMRKRAKGSEGDDGFGSRRSTPLEPDSSYNSRQATPFDQRVDQYSNIDMNRSSWEIVNPGRPMPGMLSPPEQTHYYQPSVHQSMLGPNVEDVTFKKMGVPGMQYENHNSGPLTGIPGNPHPDLLPPQQQQQPPPQVRTPGPLDNIQVDPQLLEFDNSVGLAPGDGASVNSQPDMWQMSGNGQQQYLPNGLLAPEPEQYQPQQQSYPGNMQNVMDGQNMWSEGQVESGSQFDDWFGTGVPY